MDSVAVGNNYPCANCGESITEVFEGSSVHNQFRDCLEFQINFGYGMLIDADPETQIENIKVALCRDCSTGLVLSIPAFRNAIEAFLGANYKSFLFGID